MEGFYKDDKGAKWEIRHRHGHHEFRRVNPNGFEFADWDWFYRDSDNTQLKTFMEQH